MLRSIDTLVVGQGLAGQILAYSLVKAGQSIGIVSDPNQPATSDVCAGMITPITGKRFAKSPRFEQYVEIAESFYRTLSQQTGQSLIKDLRTLRLSNDPHFKQRAIQRQTDPTFQPYLPKPGGQVSIHGLSSEDQWGIELTGGHQIDVKHLRQVLKDQLSSHVIATGNVTPSDFQTYKNKVLWNGIQIQAVVWATGWSSAPISPALEPIIENDKSHFLRLRIPGLSQDKLLNNGYWLKPIGHQCFDFGASHAWEFSHDRPTRAGYTPLTQILAEWINTPYQVLALFSGVKSVTKDRTPLVGPYRPGSPHYLFTGFGSKGCLWIPYYAKNLTAHLANGHPIDEDVLPTRFN